MGEPSACDIILGILNLCQCCCLTIQCCDTIDRWCDERNHDEDRGYYMQLLFILINIRTNN